MRLSRRMQTAVALAVTAGLLFVGTNAGAADEVVGSAVTSTQHIQVTTTPAAYEGPCLTKAEALSFTTAHTTEDTTPDIPNDSAEYFVLTIEVAGDLCTPITDVKAVIYRLPANFVVDGFAWPQTLVQQLGFTIQEAGTIEVRFTKTCSPVQFDVITGGTPDIIGLPPLGIHGPLLFEMQAGTALQYRGLPKAKCTPTQQQVTTTTSTTTTTTPDDDDGTTTTLPDDIDGTTTTIVGDPTLNPPGSSTNASTSSGVPLSVAG